MGQYNEKTTGLVWFSIQAVVVLTYFWTLTNAQERDEDKFQEHDAEEYQIQPNEPNSPDLLEQISNEMASAAKQAYQDVMEKQTKCRRMEGDGRFYDPSSSSCKACKDYCLNSNYCGMQCEAYFVKIEAEAERNRLTQKLEAEARIRMLIIGVGSFVAIMVLVYIGVYFYRELKRLRMNNNKRWHDAPTELQIHDTPTELQKTAINSDQDKDDPVSSASTIAESIHSNESETAKLFKSSRWTNRIGL